MTDDQRPSLVRVTNAAGMLIALIDPLTRKRTTVTGELEATLTRQGWDLTTQRYICWPKSETMVVIERTRHGKIRERDGRVGRGNGGGRPRKARSA